jgi:hypothetical protein
LRTRAMIGRRSQFGWPALTSPNPSATAAAWIWGFLLSVRDDRSVGTQAAHLARARRRVRPRRHGARTLHLAVLEARLRGGPVVARALSPCVLPAQRDLRALLPVISAPLRCQV